MSSDPDLDRERERATGEADDEDVDPERRIENLQAQMALLSEENARLRTEYRRARKQQYRRIGLGFLAIGLVTLGGAALFPDSREVLLALAGIGLFAAVLVYYLTPERLIAASVGERVYDAYARSSDALVTDLGLQEPVVYVPTDADSVRAFVPQHSDFRIPDAAELDHALVVPDDDRTRGLALHPTGDALYAEFERTFSGDPSDDPRELATQIADALVEVLELVDSTDPDIDVEEGRVAIGVAGSAYGVVDRFDHPVPSFAAVGLARGLETPVAVTVDSPDDDRIDALVTCTWEPADVSVEPADRSADAASADAE